MPKLKWTSHPDGRSYEARSDLVQLVVVRGQCGLTVIFSCWRGVYLVAEQLKFNDWVDAMDYCERRTREVLMAEFGEIVHGLEQK
jgi:hypothetical protein